MRCDDRPREVANLKSLVYFRKPPVPDLLLKTRRGATGLPSPLPPSPRTEADSPSSDIRRLKIYSIKSEDGRTPSRLTPQKIVRISFLWKFPFEITSPVAWTKREERGERCASGRENNWRIVVTKLSRSRLIASRSISPRFFPLAEGCESSAAFGNRDDPDSELPSKFSWEFSH